MKGIELCDGYVKVKVNPKIHPLDIVYSAAYVFLDRAYVLLDSDEKDTLILLKPKGDENLEKLGLEFANELVNYASYKANSELNKETKNIILTRAMFSNDEESFRDAVLERSEEVKIPWDDKKD